jgi:hypothetical protein
MATVQARMVVDKVAVDMSADEVQKMGFVFPSYTTTNRDLIVTPPAGMTILNTTTAKLNFYNGSAWAAVTSV